jgi:hypothetical protein
MDTPNDLHDISMKSGYFMEQCARESTSFLSAKATDDQVNDVFFAMLDIFLAGR